MIQMDAPDNPILALLSSAPRSVTEMCRLLEISQPTMSRRLRQLGDAVVLFGAQRARRYACRRRVRGVDRFTLFRVTVDGQLEQWGSLHPVKPEGFVLIRTEPGRSSKWYPALPWWLLDMRPQGFLGRAFAREYAQRLSLPSDLTLWQDDHVMLALSAESQDMVGNLLIGEQARGHWLTQAPPRALTPAELPAWYCDTAARALGGEVPGPSAGGEQPKFTAYVETDQGLRHVIVKFSARQDNANVRRWKNLLACEHLALATLRAAGVPAAASRILDFQSQRFLEVQRFDRSGAAGRHGVISLGALDAEYVGHGGAWPAVTQMLAKQGKISSADFAMACRLYGFGLLIGNGDMHNGNLSFLHDGAAPFVLAPIYDMLPMMLAPRTSGLIPEIAAMILPAELPKTVWNEMLPLARQYWQQVSASALIDDDFRLVVGQMQARMDVAERQIARLV